MKQQEEGWRSRGDKHVCSKCFSDYAIKDFINGNLQNRSCSYCKRVSKKTIAANMDEVLSFIAAGLSREYDIPENCLPWDSSEGGWQCREPEDAYDLISSSDWINEKSKGFDKLRQDLISSFSDRQFVPHDPFSMSVVEGLSYSWGSFCTAVKHHTRFVFFKLKSRRRKETYNHPDERYENAPVYTILEQIGRLASEYGLIRNLPRKTVIFRARHHKLSQNPTTVSELGAPPATLASQSRMSPAGISMLYGAENEKTAFLETYDTKSRRRLVTFSKFITSRRLKILDLTAIPDVPSIFDAAAYNQRNYLSFLHLLKLDMAKPVAHDGREHYEYVPTQVVAEYFRHVFKNNGKRGLDGLSFKSSRTGAGKCYCIFATPDNCSAAFRSPASFKPSYKSKSDRMVVFSNSHKEQVSTCAQRWYIP